MRVVALVGYSGSGKSEVGKILVDEFGYSRVKFADPLKDMLRAIGHTEAEIEGELKEAPRDLLQGKSPRHAMVTLGTEWGRDMIGADFWTGLWKRRALAILGMGGGRVVVDDCRFPNEAALVTELGGEVWRVVRPGVVPAAHVSESGAASLPAHRTILNDAAGGDWRDHLATQARGYLLGAYLESDGAADIGG